MTDYGASNLINSSDNSAQNGRIAVSLSPGRDRIILTFQYDPDIIWQIKSLADRKFVAADKALQGVRGPLWHIPADLSHAARLRRVFGDEKIAWDPDILEWGRAERLHEDTLRTMATSLDAELKVLPDVLPELYEFCQGRPYQLADIAFMAHARNPLNANAPGLGKTAETIASIFEAEIDEGPHIVFCQRTAMDVVWRYELERWQSYEVITCDGPAWLRKEWVRYARELAEAGEPFWFLINTQQLGSVHIPDLQMIDWNTLTVDEFHKVGLSNAKTRTSQTIKQFRAQKRIGLSGTPIGGKAEKLWDILNFLEPKKFSSRWAWYRQWLNLHTNYATGHQEPGAIRREVEEEFYEHHAMYMVRRLRHEVRKELPEQNISRIWIPFTECSQVQQDQYVEFANKAEIEIENNNLSATSILAEYTRLRQFAISTQRLEVEEREVWSRELEGPTIENFLQVFPTEDCVRLPTIERLLGDYGIGDGGGQAIIFSQFTKVANMYAQWFAVKHPELQVATLTGETKRDRRTEIVQDFEAGGKIDLLIMNTTAGGLSITLNNSNLIIMNDETFNPDDQTQAMDRNRENSADIYFLGTSGTIEEYVVHAINKKKRGVNYTILDARRDGLRAIQRAHR